MHGIFRLLTIFFLSCFLGQIVCGAPPSTKEADIAGVVMAVKKKVRITNAEGKMRTATLKGKIYPGDSIRTGDKAFLKILFTDGTVMKLIGNSSLEINDYLYDEENNTAKLDVSAYASTVAFLSGKISDISPDTFHLRTPTATIGIRGSYAELFASGEHTFITGVGVDLTDAQGKKSSVEPGHTYYSDEEGALSRKGEISIFSGGNHNPQAFEELANAFLAIRAEEEYLPPPPPKKTKKNSTTENLFQAELPRQRLDLKALTPPSLSQPDLEKNKQSNVKLRSPELDSLELRNVELEEVELRELELRRNQVK